MDSSSLRILERVKMSILCKQSNGDEMTCVAREPALPLSRKIEYKSISESWIAALLVAKPPRLLKRRCRRAVYGIGTRTVVAKVPGTGSTYTQRIGQMIGRYYCEHSRLEESFA
jgi:hypothetical protein